MNYPLLEQLDSSICDLVPGESIEFGGEWTASSRRAYKSAAQLGTGSGPYVEVVDFRWRGALASAAPISGIAFLPTADNLYWAKAPEVWRLRDEVAGPDRVADSRSRLSGRTLG